MRATILSPLVLILIFFASCEKRVQYDGTVYDKNGSPVSNIEVKFWYADSDDSFIPERTDDKGVFVFNKRLQKGRKVKELTINTLQGAATKALKPEGESGMKVDLK